MYDVLRVILTNTPRKKIVCLLVCCVRKKIEMGNL